MVALPIGSSSGWKTGWSPGVRCARHNRRGPCAFRNSFELMVSDTREGMALRDRSEGVIRHRRLVGVEAVGSGQPHWTPALLFNPAYLRDLDK